MYTVTIAVEGTPVELWFTHTDHVGSRINPEEPMPTRGIDVNGRIDFRLTPETMEIKPVDIWLYRNAPIGKGLTGPATTRIVNQVAAGVQSFLLSDKGQAALREGQRSFYKQEIRRKEEDLADLEKQAEYVKMEIAAARAQLAKLD